MKHVVFVFTLLLIVGCAQPAAPTAEETAVAAETTAPIATAVPTPPLTETAPPATAVAGEPTAAVDNAPISDEEARNLMYDMAFESAANADAALARVLAANDDRFISVLIELFRARQIGLVRSLGVDEIIPALETLSGQTFGPDWGAWIEWYGGTALTTPPEFTDWKARILQVIDPRFGEFLQERFPRTIRVEEILWGGVVVDGIPALDNPAMLAAADADYLEPWDPVFGLAINGDARAYPLRILDWHEMANDVIGGVPVSLAYCTLCGAAIAYDGRASNGETYTFGSSGFLYRSNKLMYDRQTRTLWNQLTGEPVLGELVETDVTLDILPVVLTTWDEWQRQHPQTLVVDEETGYARTYEPGAAYGNYFADAETMFPVWQRSEELRTKAQVFALRLNDVPKAYPLEVVTAAQVVNDMLAGTNVVLVANGSLVEVDGVNQYVGPVTYTAGAEVRAYERGDVTFQPGAEAGVVVDGDGRSWQVTEDALLGPEGQELPRLGGHLAYWFGWYAFYPETLVYEE